MFVCMYKLMGYKPVTNSDAHPLTQKPSSETMDWDLPGHPIPQFDVFTEASSKRLVTSQGWS